MKTRRPRYDVAQVIEANPILDYLERRNLPVKKAGAEWVALCPLHDERSPSFYVNSDKGVFLCRGCGEGGDVIRLHMKWEGVDFPTACKQLGGNATDYEPVRRLSRRVEPDPGPVRQPIEWPSDCRFLTDSEVAAVATSRELDPRGIHRAQDAGTLCFGTQRGCPSWILSDSAKRSAEARRIDRKDFPAIGRKADTLRKSKKDWLVGAASPLARKATHLVLVEGGPDALAVHHIAAVYDKPGLFPLAILGQGIKAAHPACLSVFNGRRVTIIPDIKSGEYSAPWVQAWSAIAYESDAAAVDVFHLALATRDDSITDLNDLVASQQQAISRLINHV